MKKINGGKGGYTDSQVGFLKSLEETDTGEGARCVASCGVVDCLVRVVNPIVASFPGTRKVVLSFEGPTPENCPKK